ncbi:MAG: hypothetical protein HRT36_07975 [Alphaproteobacteria bacterium]|nr:hypothetical protein [Alphaproteobacteria bacterium]
MNRKIEGTEATFDTVASSVFSSIRVLKSPTAPIPPDLTLNTRLQGANHLRDWLTDIKAISCIPLRKNRKVGYDAELYKLRNIIERVLNRLKDWHTRALRTLRCISTFKDAVHYISPLSLFGAYESMS